MSTQRLIACLLCLLACTLPAIGQDDVNWLRIRYIGELDAPIPTIYVTTARIAPDGILFVRPEGFDFDDFDELLVTIVVVTLSEYEGVLTNVRDFAAERPNLERPREKGESSFGDFRVTESAGGQEQDLFTVALPDSCDFLLAIGGNLHSDNLDRLRKETAYTRFRIDCPSDAVD